MTILHCFEWSLEAFRSSPEREVWWQDRRERERAVSGIDFDEGTCGERHGVEAAIPCVPSSPEFVTADWQATIFKIVARGIKSGASMLGIIIAVFRKVGRRRPISPPPLHQIEDKLQAPPLLIPQSPLVVREHSFNSILCRRSGMKRARVCTAQSGLVRIGYCRVSASEISPRPPSLTSPDTIPLIDTKDQTLSPPPASAAAIVAAAIRQIQLITSPNSLSSPFIDDPCAECQAAVLPAKITFLAMPFQGANISIALYSTEACEVGLGQFELADVLVRVRRKGMRKVEVILNADVGRHHGQAICSKFANGACPRPPTIDWLVRKTKAGSAVSASYAEWRTPQGAALIGLPRFKTGAESIPVLAGILGTGFNFTTYTGDLVSHNPMNELSRDYVLYTEASLRILLSLSFAEPATDRRLRALQENSRFGFGVRGAQESRHTAIMSLPISMQPSSVLTSCSAQDSPHSLGGNLTDQFSWNYDPVAGLWGLEGWIEETTAQLARANYGAYMVQRGEDLRVIILNTDFWYASNVLNYFNMTNPDNSGMLRFLTDEL
ncbi:hypothetical protein DFH09DRAFT_1068710 [Mycena vulgaris]|nr:hypothetical protein DFH09DRAFT_1068710 [Mycena vulgaris]